MPSRSARRGTGLLSGQFIQPNPLTMKKLFLALSVLALIAPAAVKSETVAVPCFNGGGSGGWMYNNLPKHYFPLGLITVNETPIRSIKAHPDYNPNAPWNKYGTCVIVPAKYP